MRLVFTITLLLFLGEREILGFRSFVITRKLATKSHPSPRILKDFPFAPYYFKKNLFGNVYAFYLFS